MSQNVYESLLLSGTRSGGPHVDAKELEIPHGATPLMVADIVCTYLRTQGIGVTVTQKLKPPLDRTVTFNGERRSDKKTPQHPF
jgi:hypothetical protein